jgi:hypothetical protein
MCFEPLEPELLSYIVMVVKANEPINRARSELGIPRDNVRLTFPSRPRLLAVIRKVIRKPHRLCFMSCQKQEPQPFVT